MCPPTWVFHFSMFRRLTATTTPSGGCNKNFMSDGARSWMVIPPARLTSTSAVDRFHRSTPRKVSIARIEFVTRLTRRIGFSGNSELAFPHESTEHSYFFSPVNRSNPFVVTLLPPATASCPNRIVDSSNDSVVIGNGSIRLICWEYEKSLPSSVGINCKLVPPISIGWKGFGLLFWCRNGFSRNKFTGLISNPVWFFVFL